LICEPETVALKPDLCHASDIAEAITFSLGLVLQQRNLDRNTARRWMRNLRCKKSIIRAGSRAHYLPDFPLSPLVAPDQTHRNRIFGLDLFKFPFGKVHNDKSMRAIRKIENGLPSVTVEPGLAETDQTT
jgi:hypothetical protein